MDRSFRTPLRAMSRSSAHTDHSHSSIGFGEPANSNISVIARFRPLADSEHKSILQEHTDTQCQINISEAISDFTFDRVFGPTASQQDVFDYCESTVQDVLAGYNGTILAYGQSGAGKTTTLMGPKMQGDSRGLIPRIVDQIWAAKTLDHKCSVAYFEIYKERVKDLLDPLRDNLPVHESSGGGFYVKNLTWSPVATVQQVYDRMQQGNTNRAVASTGCNSQSSRSHSLFAIEVSHNNQKGLLYLVDLAGSEKVSKTRATGQVLEEAKSINRSLSTLGMVINALTDPRIGHVPYRDSKLTRILQESLGGNSRTTLIIHCAATTDNSNETLSTLRFGSRAKAVRNRPILNVDTSTVKLELLKQELVKWRSGAEVPIADRVEFDYTPSRPSSSLSSLSFSERRRSLTSPRQISADRSFGEFPRAMKHQGFTEEPTECVESVRAHLEASVEVLKSQNEILENESNRLLEVSSLASAQCVNLEKQLVALELELASENQKVQNCLDSIRPRVSVLNIY